MQWKNCFCMVTHTVYVLKQQVLKSMDNKLISNIPSIPFYTDTGMQSSESHVLLLLRAQQPEPDTKADGCLTMRQVEKLIRNASLYVHWPFCKHLCPYCNFNKYKSQNVDEQRMEKCISSEIKNFSLLYGIKKIKTIYFGGGTPSLCQPSAIENILQSIGDSFELDCKAEISMECNPSSGELEKLRSFKNAGVNRVSIGVQALNDADLSKLGRDHTTSEAIEYMEEANKVFQQHVTIDLMFGRPAQTVNNWIKELDFALQLNSNHIPLYQLTMERSTPMEKQFRRGEIILPKSGEVGEMYHSAVQKLEEAGLHRYEVANFARKGYESKHNSAYWNGNQYIGIGPGAHGRLHVTNSGVFKRLAYVQTPVPEKWMQQVETNGDGIRKLTELSFLETLEELILQGMRSKHGVDQTIFSMFSSGIQLNDLLKYDSIKHLVSEEYIQVNFKGIRATSKGMSLLDSIVPEICIALEKLISGTGIKNYR